MSMNKVYCPSPFVGLDIEPDGEIKPCCLFETQLQQNGQVLNINDISITQAITSPEWVQLQQDMISGTPVTGCRQCYVEEKSGATSRRQREQKNYPQANTIGIRTVDIKLGNTCNLKCRICNPRNSSLINSENKQLDQYHLADTSKLKWYTDGNLSQLREHFGTIEHMEFMGGEPMLDKNHLKLLEEMVSEGQSQNVTLSYVTNGTIFPEYAMAQIFPHFKKVTFVLSADGIAQTFEYNRHPGRWETFEANLLKYLQTPHTFVISYSVNPYSIWGVPDALDFYAQHGVKVWFNFVHNKDCNLQLLPWVLKHQIATLLRERETLAWVSIYNDSGIEEVINWMMADDKTSDFEEFIRMTNMRDKYRRESVTKIIPDLASYV